jgi:HPt (histidine-containing phosphotransfer) domain-containing protein
MDEFLTKPIAPNLMFSLIAHCLAQRAGRTACVADIAPAVTAAVLASHDPAMLDVAALSTTFGGDAAKMRKYATMFVDSARDGLAELARAIESGDLQRASELGHRMKSSARAVGAERFSQLCARLEDQNGAGPADQARALLVSLQAMLPVLAEHMAGELAESSG